MLQEILAIGSYLDRDRYVLLLLCENVYVCMCVCFMGTDILAGQSREYSDDTKQATDILCHLREDIPSTECGWLASLDNALANIYIRREEWRLALGSLDRMMDLVPEATRAEVSNMAAMEAANQETLQSFLTETYLCEILSRQGRILIQAGGISEARELFGAAENLWNSSIEPFSSLSSIGLPEELFDRYKTLHAVTQSTLEINDGLFDFSNNNYGHAVESFSKAIGILREGCGTFFLKYRTEDWIGPSFAGSEAPLLLYNEAMNNTSLCHLYTCNMRDAVATLETLVREDPTAFLTERVAFNLCTLYELGSDSAVATRKKQVLQLIAKRFFLHDVGPESFRVT